MFLLRGIIMAMETKASKLTALKNMFTARTTARVAIIFLVAFMAWYQFDGAEKNMFALLKNDTASLVHSARTLLASSFSDEKLSTGSYEAAMETDAVNATWQFKKAEAGESVWSVYAEAIEGNEEIAFQAQVVNGLKNITLLQNNISVERAEHNSLIIGQEYSVLSHEAIMEYAGKVNEANEMLKSGATMSDLDSDLQLAYQLANAPSQQFVSSLSLDLVPSVYQFSV